MVVSVGSGCMFVVAYTDSAVAQHTSLCVPVGMGINFSSAPAILLS